MTKILIWICASLFMIAAAASYPMKSMGSEVDQNIEYEAPYSDFIIPSDQYDAPSPKTISKTQALEDFIKVERIFRRGYAGFEYYAKYGTDWNALFKKGTEEISKMPETIESVTYRDWLREFFLFTNDGHLRFSTVSENGKTSGESCFVSQEAYGSALSFEDASSGWVVQKSTNVEVPSGSLLLNCQENSLQSLLSPMVQQGDGHVRPAWLLLVLSSKQPQPLSCKIRQQDGNEKEVKIPLHRLGIAKSGDGGEAFEMTEGEVPVVRLCTFTITHIDKQEVFVKTAKRLRKRKAFMVDVRGNGGGTDRFVTRWFKKLRGKDFYYMVVDRLVSEVTVQGQLQSALEYLARGGLTKEETKRLKKQIENTNQRLLQMKKVFQNHPNRTWKKGKSKWSLRKGEARSPYKGCMVTLMDKYCASACESFILYARQMKSGLLVGENSAGVKHFGDCLVYRLPHSKIRVKVGYKYFHERRSDQGAPPGIGYLPDIWIDSEEPQEVAVKIAECMAVPECASSLRQMIERKQSMTSTQ